MRQDHLRRKVRNIAEDLSRATPVAAVASDHDTAERVAMDAKACKRLADKLCLLAKQLGRRERTPALRIFAEGA